ncbi:MAG: universal stress protein [Burkholderiaceae bacterium]
MTPKKIICPLGSAHSQGDIVRVIELVGRSNAHLTIPLIQLAPPMPIVGDLPVTDTWSVEMHALQGQVIEQANELEQSLHRSGLSADVMPIVCAPNEIEHLIGWHGRFADVALAATALRNDPDIQYRSINGLLFESGKPLLVEPPLREAVPLQLTPTKVLIAWDGGLACSRAVTHAINLLQATTEVHVVCIDLDVDNSPSGRSQGWELGEFLSHHSVNVNVVELAAGGLSVDALLNRHATEVGAELIVMGAYGHSRLRAWVLGSTTRAMLKNCVVPIYMAH